MTGSSSLVLKHQMPNVTTLSLDSIGLYLNIPFCKKPCLYCPYFKEHFQKEKAEAYTRAVKTEVDFYHHLLDINTLSSFYIGGGTPTSMIHHGFEDLIAYITNSFNLHCDISCETHPNDVSEHMIQTFHDLSIEHISMGIESFNNTYLAFIDRPYRNEHAIQATTQLVEGGFDCVNIDIMFGYPNQTIKDVRSDIETALRLDVDQISTYPIFTFPHTKLTKRLQLFHKKLPGLLMRRALFKEIEQLCYDAGYKRTSVWAFTKKDRPKYSSVTIPTYLGLGAGAGSLIQGSFFMNIFDIDQYIETINSHNKPPIALTIDFSEEEEMIHWLYWRIYETEISKKEFNELYNKDFDQEFGRLFFLFEKLGLCKDTGDRIIMSDKGNYWVHVIQNIFSLDFIGKVWNACLTNPNTESIELI